MLLQSVMLDEFALIQNCNLITRILTGHTYS